MGYYIRVLGEKETVVPLTAIRQGLDAEDFKNVDILVEEAEDGEEGDWIQVTLKRKRGRELVTITRDVVEPGSLGEAEIQEFIESVEAERPASAARWLERFLPRVRAIYALQILFDGADMKNWRPVHIAQAVIFQTVGGILQADFEGFSQREGFHILWQFSPRVKGPWQMAILSHEQKWLIFEMERGNPEHVAAFLQGKVPEGVTIDETCDGSVETAVS
jgi:hypothetical protein